MFVAGCACLAVSLMGPLSFACALLGVLLLAAGASPKAKRAVFGPRRSRAAPGAVEQA
jgi:hypothetical protein